MLVDRERRTVQKTSKEKRKNWNEKKVDIG